MRRTIVEMTCATCSMSFFSEIRTRRFCSVKCRANHPEFKEAVAARNAMRRGVRNSNLGPDRQGHNIDCANACGRSMYRSAKALAKKSRHYCGRNCYYQHLARLFDRDIGVLSALPELHNYDEILASEQLRCVIPNCGWRGHNLSLHVHLAHGITEAEFKERAGFNKSTGVISALMRKKLEHERYPKNTANARNAIDRVKTKKQTPRREALEHYQKAMALRFACTQS